MTDARSNAAVILLKYRSKGVPLRAAAKAGLRVLKRRGGPKEAIEYLEEILKDKK
jgi:hypothetical protein